MKPHKTLTPGVIMLSILRPVTADCQTRAVGDTVHIQGSPVYDWTIVDKIFDTYDHYEVNFLEAVTWAFEFENQPWFAGFRPLATNGVDKPVLNVSRMYGMMQGNRIAVSGDLVMISSTKPWRRQGSCRC